MGSTSTNTDTPSTTTTTTARTTTATKNTNGAVNTLEDTYNAYIGAVKGTQYEQDYINAYKSGNLAGMDAAVTSANASKNNPTSTGAGPTLDMNAVKGLLTKINSLPAGAKKILND